MFLLIVTILVLFTCFKVYKWWTKPRFRLDRDYEDSVSNTMAGVDDGFSDDDDDEGFSFARGRTVFRAKMVRLAKTEFGLLKRSEANRLMVRKFLRDKMREHGVRDQHIVDHLDIIVRMAFIPSRAEIEAHKMGASFEAHVREQSVTSDWISAVLDFGTMLGFKAE